MNSSTHSVAPQAEEQLPILEQVYSIIDSKIQYADYLTQLAIQPFLTQDILKGGATFSHRHSSVQQQIGSTGSFLCQIEKTSKAKSLLLIIRTKLCIRNAKISFELLTDDRFLNYTDKALFRLLEEAILEE